MQVYSAADEWPDLPSPRIAKTKDRVMAEQINCYDVPQYWDLAFSDDTQLEAEFVAAAAKKYCDFPVERLYEPGCGGGRLVVELAKKGFHVTGIDQSQQAINFAKQKLASHNLTAELAVADMREVVAGPPFDIAYCLVNTFRHLLTEADAKQHLESVSQMLRPGGLYIIGMHLLPPDADEEDEEDWSVETPDVTVHMQLVAENCDRTLRQETLRFSMTAAVAGEPTPICHTSNYRMRIYEASDIRELLASVSVFELVDVFDFWYDIEDPLTLSDELGDTVLVLRKKS